MNVILTIPLGHARSKTITPLTEVQLEQADLHLDRAAQSLRRSRPTNIYKANLLRRNHWTIRYARTVYAFGQFEDPHNPAPSKVELVGRFKWPLKLTHQKMLSVYDMYHKTWFLFPPIRMTDADIIISPLVFKRVYGKPLLDTESAVVGSRNLDESTRQEIVALFERTADSARQHREQMQLITKKLKEFHISPSHPNQQEGNRVPPWADK